jgi:HTH-type transcriptional regulator/antitoxin HigA
MAGADGLRSDAEYEATLARIHVLMDAAPGSEDERELERLAALVHTYEDVHYPIAPPTAEAARAFRREQEEGTA